MYISLTSIHFQELKELEQEVGVVSTEEGIILRDLYISLTSTVSEIDGRGDTVVIIPKKGIIILIKLLWTSFMWLLVHFADDDTSIEGTYMYNIDTTCMYTNILPWLFR